MTKTIPQQPSIIAAETEESPPVKEQLSLIARPAVWLIRQYQYWARPVMGKHCRFYPSCSDYSLQAIHKYGFFRGILKGSWRICRCHPFHRGGVDLP